jgi:hypothetical protein
MVEGEDSFSGSQSLELWLSVKVDHPMLLPPLVGVTAQLVQCWAVDRL